MGVRKILKAVLRGDKACDVAVIAVDGKNCEGVGKVIDGIVSVEVLKNTIEAIVGRQNEIEVTVSIILGAILSGFGDFVIDIIDVIQEAMF